MTVGSCLDETVSICSQVSWYLSPISETHGFRTTRRSLAALPLKVESRYFFLSPSASLHKLSLDSLWLRESQRRGGNWELGIGNLGIWGLPATRQLERLIDFGFCLLVDVFLSVLTMAPLRATRAVFTVLYAFASGRCGDRAAPSVRVRVRDPHLSPNPTPSKRHRRRFL